MSEPTFTADQLRQCAEDYREKIPGERTDDELVAMLEFAARLVVRTTWQPMKTAPENTRVLISDDGRCWMPLPPEPPKCSCQIGQNERGIFATGREGCAVHAEEPR